MQRKRGAFGAACGLAVAAALGACKADGPTEQVGVVAGPVQGVRYRTPTSSGLTDGRGQFRYRSGETVSFFLGGTALGAVPGAARVTPFDLAGVAPPEGEEAVCLALARTGEPSDFGRAVNLALLFMNLDGDADPANGFDLSGADAALTGTTLRPDAPPAVFAARDARVLGTSNRLVFRSSTADAVLWLYQAVGLRVPAHARTSATRIDLPAGTIGHRQEASHDAQGRELLLRTDLDGDGQFDSEIESAYDAEGRATSTSTRLALADDGRWTWLARLGTSRDAQGRVLAIDRRVESPLGTLTLATVLRYDYDGHGRLIGGGTEEDRDGAGAVPGSTSRATYTTGADGLVASSETEIDRQGDGVVDAVFRTTYLRDAAGRDRGSISERDDDADGTFDARQESQSTRDVAGNELLGESRAHDVAGGPLTFLLRSASSYDALGNRLTFVSDRDVGADGAVEQREQATWTRDQAGRVLTETVERFDPAGAPPTTRFGSQNTYDAAGRTLTSVTWSDAAGDGVTVRSTTVTSTYDAAGRVAVVVEEDDPDGDGQANRRTRSTSIRDAAGLLTAVEGEVDLEADGTWDGAWRVEYGAVALDDGLPYLARTCAPPGAGAPAAIRAPAATSLDLPGARLR